MARANTASEVIRWLLAEGHITEGDVVDGRLAFQSPGVTKPCAVCRRPTRKFQMLCSTHYAHYWVHAPIGCGDDEFIDEMAVVRAMAGDQITLTTAERADAVRQLTAKGCSAQEIADRLRMSERHVVRYRQKLAAVA